MRVAWRSIGAAVACSYLAPAEASAFYPETGKALDARSIAALGPGSLTIASRRFVAIDDMLFSTTALANSGFNGRRWPNARLVYDASALNAAQARRFREHCALWEARTKIRCVPRTSENGGYLVVLAEEGNHSRSQVGYPGPDETSMMTLCCFDNAVMVAHEIGHALGMTHEHMRPKRDKFVSIKWDNISSGGKDQFKKRRNLDVYGGYDLLSVMHYKQDNFSKNGQPTIVVRPPNERLQSVIGMGGGPSEMDIAGMNARYP